MKIKVRFAPSPTGKLHIGNIRIALMNYVFAQQNSGEFLLRIDDTDKTRSTKEYEDGIYEDLAWLGLPNKMAARQSSNIDKYNEAFEYLKQKELIYPCFETQEELSLARKIQLSNGIPPIYKRKSLTKEQIEQRIKNGEKPYWRFAIDHSILAEWKDIVHGNMAIQLSSLSDPVIVKPDGSYVYTFASVIDDINMGITHIIRGDDHVTNTAIQIQIFKALSSYMPIFAHLPLISSTNGEDISKRAGSTFSIQSLRENGAESFAIIAALASLGSTYEYSAMDNIGDIIKKLDFNKLSLSAPKFSLETVYTLTQKILSNYKYDYIKTRLQKLTNSKEDLEVYWEVFKKNISKFDEFLEWYNVCTMDCFNYVTQDKGFAKILLDEFNNNSDSWETWIMGIKSKTSRRGALLFHEIRLILTGKDKGPELKDLFKLISKDLINLRLNRQM